MCVFLKSTQFTYLIQLAGIKRWVKDISDVVKNIVMYVIKLFMYAIKLEFSNLPLWQFVAFQIMG